MSTGIELGSIHGLLTYIGPTGKKISAGRSRSTGLFACRCGAYVTRVISKVKGGSPKSCGCLSGGVAATPRQPKPRAEREEIEWDTPYTPSHPAARLVKARHSQGGAIGNAARWTGGRSSLERLA